MNWDNSFYLMNKDNRILEFIMNKNNFGEVVFEITKEYSELKPVGFIDLDTWIRRRQAPKHRAHIADLLRQCGCYDLDGYVRLTHALTLNDTFWVMPATSNLKWKEVSLYENEFNETISKIAFEGGLFGEQFTSTSPEFGTDGAYAKCWIRKETDIYLYKQGSEGARNTGLEPYSEFYASQLSSKFCNDYVAYDLEKYRGRLVSSCKLFTDDNIGFVPTSKVINKYGVSDLLTYFKRIGSENDFRRMLVFDALTLNTDRHMGNYGLCVNNDTQDILSMAPVFDNNQSLLPYAEEKDFDDIDKYLESRPTTIGNDFNQVAHQMLTPGIKSDLNNLKGFKFKKHEKYNLPEWRLTCIEGIIEKQIYNIINDIHLYVPLELNENSKERKAVSKKQR